MTGMMFFGETLPGATPRGYREGRNLLEHEGINREARIREVQVYSGNTQTDLTLTHFVVAHWWVVFQDDDGHWWSAENVGSLLLQRLDSQRDGKCRRKAIWQTQVLERPGFVTIPLKTRGAQSRKMEELIEWMLQQSKIHYDLITNNCQRFGSELTKYLAGISVAHTPALIAPIGPVFVPMWKSVNYVRGFVNRIF
jgi:hypothetical protein